MPVYFLDSSALVKRYRLEAGSERLRTLLNAANRLFIARLAAVEVCAALVRRGRASGNATREVDTALAAFDRDLSRSFEIIELDLLVVKQAIILVRKHFLARC